MSVTLIQLRRGLAADWTAENPVLHLAEPGVEIDTGKAKIGDGATSWAELPYLGDPTLPMELLEALEGTEETPRSISAAVLAETIGQLSSALQFSNVHMQPIWDGSGSHPTKPEGIPDSYFEIWRQPTAPLVGGEYAAEGDEWEVTE